VYGLVEPRRRLGQERGARWPSAVTEADVRRLLAVAQPENRPIFEAVASSVSFPGRLSGAVLCLAYAFALVVETAASQVDAEWPDDLKRARPFTDEDLVELHLHYSEEGWAKEYDMWPLFRKRVTRWFSDRACAPIVDSLTASFNDQVDRGTAAEKAWDLRKSMASPDWVLYTADGSGMPTFLDALFEWGVRFRLGERLIAEGCDLKTLRFDTSDPTDINNILYEEAWERYAPLAAEQNPVSPDVESAVRAGTDWLAKDFSATDRLVISTTAVRGYLWRSVEHGPVALRENQELSEAVERSRTFGDGRRQDEPVGMTLYYAAVQCMADGLSPRQGSIGGLISGARNYERAFWDTTSDLEEIGLKPHEKTVRLAFAFGVWLADAERILTQQRPSMPPA
jgi:hypothetical protein